MYLTLINLFAVGGIMLQFPCLFICFFKVQCQIDPWTFFQDCFIFAKSIPVKFT